MHKNYRVNLFHKNLATTNNIGDTLLSKFINNILPNFTCRKNLKILSHFKNSFKRLELFINFI